MLRAALLLLLAIANINFVQALEVGIGVSDITPTPDKNPMMGYSNDSQKANGLHTRLFAKAFVIQSSETNKKVAFVNCDLGMISQLTKIEVINRLQAKYGNIFTDENVLLSATHTHAGPGGYFHYKLYKLAADGFNRPNFDLIVDGIVAAIEKANSHLENMDATFSQGELTNASFNQSRVAYLNNLDQQNFESDRNTVMSQLIFRRASDDSATGIINWFSVHATTLSRDNKLISGDNKGTASLLFERIMRKMEGRENFVAAFAQSDEGDISSDIFTKDEKRTLSEIQRNYKVANLQTQKAISLLRGERSSIGEIIDYRHVWMHMPDMHVAAKYTEGKEAVLCSPALGFSFAAGSEDGPTGLPYFIEGMTVESNKKLPILVRAIIAMARPILGSTAKLTRCHYPKPILVATGGNVKNSWTPEILPFQLLRIGKLVIIGVPGEMTTMSGRRLRKIVLDNLKKVGVEYAVIAGLSNTYSGYVTTFEEYQKQQYEGASTHFGPNTLSAYLQSFDQLSQSMVDGVNLNSGMRPNYVKATPQKGFIREGIDYVPKGQEFGKYISGLLAKYKAGEEVIAEFQSAVPRSRILREKTSLEVQKWSEDGWQPYLSDSDPETSIVWSPHSKIWGKNLTNAKISWQSSFLTPKGRYRIVHTGKWKNASDQYRSFDGTSPEFVIEE